MPKLKVDIPNESVIWVSNKVSPSGSYRYVMWMGFNEDDACRILGGYEETQQLADVCNRLGIPVDLSETFPFQHCHMISDSTPPEVHPLVRKFLSPPPEDNEAAFLNLPTLVELENIT